MLRLIQGANNNMLNNILNLHVRHTLLAFPFNISHYNYKFDYQTLRTLSCIIAFVKYPSVCDSVGI